MPEQKPTQDSDPIVPEKLAPPAEAQETPRSLPPSSQDIAEYTKQLVNELETHAEALSDSLEAESQRLGEAVMGQVKLTAASVASALVEPTRWVVDKRRAGIRIRKVEMLRRALHDTEEALLMLRGIPVAVAATQRALSRAVDDLRRLDSEKKLLKTKVAR